MSRLLPLLYWLAAPLFCLILFWPGLWIWFQQDDFAWLSLRLQVHSARDLLWALFSPMAQGSIRPWSERGFFMGFYSLFQMHPFPYRLAVFLTQFLNITILIWLTRRLTGSAVAGLIAALFWLANSNIVTAMSWTAAYNELQCSAFLLVALALFIRYADTRQRRYYVWQWVVFLLGFGSLELMVVYPALAALFALLFARHALRAALPLFVASAAYTVLHRSLAPATVSDYYRMYFDRDLVFTFGNYWNMALNTIRIQDRMGWSLNTVNALAWLLTAGLIAFTAWRTWRRDWVPLFCWGWFLAVLSPVLPLKNHVTDYYLTIPTMGIAMLAAHSVLLWRHHRAWAAGAAVLLIAYGLPSTLAARKYTDFYFERAERTRLMVQSVAYAHQLHPDKIILLDNVDEELFWAGVYDSSFRVLSIQDVFLTPESESRIRPDAALGNLDQYFLPAAATAKALRENRAQIYQVASPQYRNITDRYTLAFESRPQDLVDAKVFPGQKHYADQLREGWFEEEAGFRWMGKKAGLVLHGPTRADQKLYIKAAVVTAQVAGQPMELRVTVEGQPMPPRVIDRDHQEFEFAYELPSSLITREQILVELEIDRIYQAPGDPRRLGLAVSAVSVR